MVAQVTNILLNLIIFLMDQELFEKVLCISYYQRKSRANKRASQLEGKAGNTIANKQSISRECY